MSDLDPFLPGFLQRLPDPPARVVIVRANRIGDFICATPAFRALRRALPAAEITLIGLPFVEDLVVRSRHLDRFVEFPGFPGMAEQFFEADRTRRFFRDMQEERFDLAIQFHGSGANSNPFTLMLGARRTVGYVPTRGTAGLLDAALAMPEQGHEVERLSALTTFLGAAPDSAGPEFPLLPEDEYGADRLLARTEPPFIGLHPATWDLIKRWPVDRFAAAARELQRRHGGTLVILGAPPDRGGLSLPEAERVAASAAGPCLDLTRKTSIGVLGAVLARLAVFLTNDSGPAHIAYALGVPSVTIFGGTDPRRWGPLRPGPHRVLAHSVPCRPCELPACPIGDRCLQGVTVTQVVEAAEDVMVTETEAGSRRRVPIASSVGQRDCRAEGS